MLGEDRARPDGVLASRLDTLPEDRWLDLLGVRWVLASRAKDLTRGAIYYDRAVTATLRPGQTVRLGSLPLGEFTRLGMISTVVESASGGEQVGVVRMLADSGARAEIPLIVGQNTALATWKAEQAPDLEWVQSWGQNGPNDPADWIAELPFARQPVTRIEIVNTSPSATVLVRALNLIDDGRQMAFPITPDSSIDRTEFFDVKLYERVNALDRAYVVPAAVVLDDEAAAHQLADPAFDPRGGVILAPSATAGQPGAVPPTIEAGQPESSAAPRPPIVSIKTNAPEQVVVYAVASRDGYLVLSDSWYPGWRAVVDGAEVPIERANLMFRAVFLPAGEHTVEFRFEPTSVRRGMLVSAASLAVTVVLVVGLGLWRRRRMAESTPGEGRS